jgi:hypothetical protein
MQRVTMLAGALALASMPELAGAGERAAPVELADLTAVRRPHPAELEAEARLAAGRRTLARSAGALLGGPVLSVAAGPRHVESGETRADVAVGLLLPIFAAGPEQRALAAALASAEPLLLAAAGSEAELALAAAYSELWRLDALAALRAEDLAIVERWLAATRRRVEEGADPAYEATLVAGERDRAALELERTRAGVAVARAALAALAPLPEGELRLVPPTEPPVCSARAGSSALERAARARAELAIAEAGLATRAESARWALASDLAREGDEDVARLGLAYRFAPRGEKVALDEVRAAAEAAEWRASELELSRLAARREAARSRLAAASALSGDDELAAGVAALEARLSEGRSRPSEALPLRRQLLAAREAAIDARAERALAAAELAALCPPSSTGVAP